MTQGEGSLAFLMEKYRLWRINETIELDGDLLLVVAVEYNRENIESRVHCENQTRKEEGRRVYTLGELDFFTLVGRLKRK